MGQQNFNTKLIAKLASGCQPNRHYDAITDVLSFLFVSSKEQLYEYYVDSNVALLCRDVDDEIVGLSIDAFVKDFLPSLIRTTSTWNLQDCGIVLEDINFVIKSKAKKVPRYSPKIDPSIIENDPISLDCLQPA